MSADTRFSSDEPRIVDAPDSWIASNLRLLAFLLLALLALAVGVGVWWQQRHARQSEANRLFAEATTSDAWLEITNRFPGTPAAPLALLRLATEAVQNHSPADALSHHERFLREYPRHPLAPVAEAARAQLLETLGRPAEARDAYQSIQNRRPTHPFADAATLGLARLLMLDGNSAAARQMLSDFLADQAQSPYAGEANRLLQTLPPAP